MGLTGWKIKMFTKLNIVQLYENSGFWLFESAILLGFDVYREVALKAKLFWPMGFFEYLLFQYECFWIFTKNEMIVPIMLYNPLFAHVYGLNELFFFHSSECAGLIFIMNIIIPNNIYNHYLAACIEPILMPAHTKADWLPFLNVCNWQQ